MTIIKADPNTLIHPGEAHARLGPSSPWTLCGVYPSMIDKYGNSVSDSSELGTAGHELLELSITEQQPPETYRGGIFNFSDEYPEGWVVDDDMIDAVTMAYDYIMEVYQDLLAKDPSTTMYAERRVDPGKWIDRDDAWGTADITIIAPALGEVRIYDYKHGSGLFVPVADNHQLLRYLIGVLAEIPVDQPIMIQKIIIGIIQPRCYSGDDGPIREQEIFFSDIMKWVEFFKAKAIETDDPNLQPVPGDHQCYFCPGRTKMKCTALTNKVISDLVNYPLDVTDNTAEFVEASLQTEMIREPDEISEEHLLSILDNASLARAFIKACEGYALRALKEGTASKALQAQYKLVRGRSTRKWSESDEKKIINKLTRFGIPKSDVVSVKVRGPAPMEKLIAKLDLTATKQRNFEKMIVKPPGAPALVPISDSRESIKPSVDEMFGDAGDENPAAQPQG